MDKITLNVEIELSDNGVRIVGSRKRESGSSELYKTIPTSYFDDMTNEDCIGEVLLCTSDVIIGLIQNN